MRKALVLASCALAISIGCGGGVPKPPDVTPATGTPSAAPAEATAAKPAATAAPKETAGEAKGSKDAVFTVKALNTGKSVSLAPGKVTVVDFWATWCAPCKKSFPALQSLYVKYQSSGLEIIGLSTDDDDSGIVAFANQFGAKFPVALDKEKALASKMKPSTMPTTFVFDKKGKQRFVHAGYRDGEDAVLEKEIKQLLAE
jgi:thiol-disulfide isomerase/thioredoxin